MAQTEKGHSRIRVFSPRGPKAGLGEPGPDGVETFVAAQTSEVISPFACILRIASNLSEFGPEVVHVQGAHTAKFGGLFGEILIFLLLRLRLSRTAVVYTVHSTWLPDELVELARSKGLGRLAGALFVLYFRVLMWLTFALVDRVSILTAGGRPPIVDAYQKFLGIPKWKLSLEQHPCAAAGAITRKGHQSPQVDAASEGITLASAGFVRADKGLHVIIEALGAIRHSLPSWRYLIAGEPKRAEDKEYARSLQDLAAKLQCSAQVVFRFAALTDDEFQGVLSAADVVVVPYLRSLGASGPLHQALGQGKATLVSDVGHNKGLVGVSLLFNPLDAHDTQEKLLAIAGDALVRHRYREAAGRHASGNTWLQLATLYKTCYLELLGRPSN